MNLQGLHPSLVGYTAATGKRSQSGFAAFPKSFQRIHRLQLDTPSSSLGCTAQWGILPGEVRASRVENLLTGLFQETIHQLATPKEKKEGVIEERSTEQQQVTELYLLPSPI